MTEESNSAGQPDNIGRLASFPEQNPDPVIEVDLDGRVTYLNPVAEERFPDLAEKGLSHPLLAELPTIIAALEAGRSGS